MIAQIRTELTARTDARDPPRPPALPGANALLTLMETDNGR
jgi:hypothetical protein